MCGGPRAGEAVEGHQLSGTGGQRVFIGGGIVSEVVAAGELFGKGTPGPIEDQGRLAVEYDIQRTAAADLEHSGRLRVDPARAIVLPDRVAAAIGPAARLAPIRADAARGKIERHHVDGAVGIADRRDGVLVRVEIEITHGADRLRIHNLFGRAAAIIFGVRLWVVVINDDLGQSVIATRKVGVARIYGCDRVIA